MVELASLLFQLLFLLCCANAILPLIFHLFFFLSFLLLLNGLINFKMMSLVWHGNANIYPSIYIYAQANIYNASTCSTSTYTYKYGDFIFELIVELSSIIICTSISVFSSSSSSMYVMVCHSLFVS